MVGFIASSTSRKSGSRSKVYLPLAAEPLSRRRSVVSRWKECNCRPWGRLHALGMPRRSGVAPVHLPVGLRSRPFDGERDRSLSRQGRRALESVGDRWGGQSVGFDAVGK